MIARREPEHQGRLAFALLGALPVVEFGTLIGSFLDVHGVPQHVASNWFGLQGFEYHDLARIWQLLLSVGLFVWVFMLFRVLRGRAAHRAPSPRPDTWRLASSTPSVHRAMIRTYVRCHRHLPHGPHPTRRCPRPGVRPP
jgi:nitric oxide reductase subunit B